jgi:tRNA threonylcarbamoyladenosine biosynthesis protein TsaE
VIELHTTSVAETREVAAALAPLLRVGDCVVLAGEMGAGKTAFTQGLAAALGVDEPVTSPTFTLVHTYTAGRLRLHHLDVYRLDRLGEVEDLGLAELLDDGAVVVEWGDAVRDALPDDRLEIALGFGRQDDDRVLEAEATGRSWDRREPQLEAAWSRFETRADSC